MSMPSLVRFLLITAVLATIIYGGLYALAVFFEPEPREVSTPVPGVKVRKQ
jgi:predicted secreted protein